MAGVFRAEIPLLFLSFVLATGLGTIFLSPINLEAVFILYEDSASILPQCLHLPSACLGLPIETVSFLGDGDAGMISLRFLFASLLIGVAYWAGRNPIFHPVNQGMRTLLEKLGWKRPPRTQFSPEQFLGEAYERWRKLQSLGIWTYINILRGLSVGLLYSSEASLALWLLSLLASSVEWRLVLGFCGVTSVIGWWFMVKPN
jgi:hypothetical protein